VIAAPRDLEAGLEPIVGIDLDSCRNPETGEIDAWAHEIINAFSSYAEVSPSGTGVKILALVDPSTRLIGGKRVIQVAAGTEHPKQVEVYVDGRFFTITGQILEWVPDELTNATAAYERLATTLTPFKTKNETRAENFASDGEEPSAETIATILGNRKAKEIWEGRKVTGDCTASGYDASLAAILGVLGVPDEEIARALCHFEHGQIGNGTLRKRGEVERQLGRLLKIANKARGEKDDYVAHGEWVWGRIQAGLQARKEAKAAGAEQGDRLRAAGVLARDMPQEAPQDPQEGRFEGEPDFDASEGVEAPDEPVAAPAGEPWPEPIDTFSEHFPSTIKVDETNMPTALLKLGRGEGARLGVDPAGICALALGACSGVISDD
jgi:hypothetical protein